MTSSLALEFVVQDLAGVHTVLAVGATRIELCGALSAGGLSPSIGAIELAVEAATDAGIPDFVNVLVRPRPGGFVYSAAEIETTVRDIRGARAAGAAGIVIGALTAAGQVDRATTRELIAAAEGMQVTFHRAIDAVPNPLDTLDTLIELGLDRVLTSGGAARSIDGLATLAALVGHSSGRLQIMAGGGVRVEDIAALAAAGVDAVHLSAKSTVIDTSPSGPGGGEQSYDQTNMAIARAAADEVSTARAAAAILGV